MVASLAAVTRRLDRFRRLSRGREISGLQRIVGPDFPVEAKCGKGIDRAIGLDFERGDSLYSFSVTGVAAEVPATSSLQFEVLMSFEQYETLQASDGEEAIQLFHSESPDLVLLDLMLPKKSGFEVLEEIRKYSNVPVILLTARGAETDKVRGLRGGADDYVTKPFGLQEVFARIAAVLRRTEGEKKETYEDDLVKLDPDTREAEARGEALKLSPKEFDLLLYLFKNKDRVVPRDELLSRVWNYRVDLNLNSRTVDTHVTRLRRKLQKAADTDQDLIIGVAKVGYRYLGEVEE